MSRVAHLHNATAAGSGSPFIVRVAGMPAEGIDLFTSGGLAARLERGEEIERELAGARAGMVERLYPAVHDAPSREARRLLLAVKRDCFNGNPLAPHRSSPLWPEVEKAGSALAARILSLEEELAAWGEELETAFDAERAEQRRRLLTFVENPGHLRGLALASPELVTYLDRLRRTSADSYGRKERSLEISLLRYTSRALLKLSPYSTFTRLALGVVREDLEETGACLVGAGWHQWSLLRVKRYLFDQVLEMLLRHPPFRAALAVTLNNTAHETEPGRYRFLRIGYWDVHPEKEDLQYFIDSFVSITLQDPRVGKLLDWLGVEPQPYPDLVARLDGEPASGETAAAFVDRLLRLGFLSFVLPWPANVGHLERCMLDFLRSLPADPGLAAILAPLSRLVAAEEGYAETAAPVEALAEIDRALDEMWDVAAELGGVPPHVVRRRSKKGGYYEDVFLAPAGPEEPVEVLRLSESTARGLLASLDPLVRLAYLHNHRHDFLHSLAGFMRQRWPGRREVGFLELFGAAQPLWKEARQFKVDNRPPGGLHTSFNPLGLAPIEALRQLKVRIWDQLDRWVEVGPEETRIHGRELAALLAEAPSWYAPSVGACPLVQMADAEGDLWVLNRIYEGTGRFASRFTPVMGERARRFYTGHYTARSTFEQAGRPVEFLDLLRVQGDTLNVHAVQTHRILEFPRESSDLPAARRLSLRDLRVQVDEETLLPRLVDASGCEYLPVHLGGTGPLFMPPLVKFLSMFGPGEILPVYPPRPTRSAGDATVRDRLVVDNIVLQRRRWIFYSETVPKEFVTLPDAEAFVAINRWRSKQGLPERMFLLEATPHFVLADRYKPQYIDFTSPLFVSLLRSALKTGTGPLVFEEPLPAPDVLPRDETGSRWAVELQLDSFTLRPRAAAAAPVSAPLPSVTFGGAMPRTEPPPAHQQQRRNHG